MPYCEMLGMSNLLVLLKKKKTTNKQGMLLLKCKKCFWLWLAF